MLSTRRALSFDHCWLAILRALAAGVTIQFRRLLRFVRRRAAPDRPDWDAERSVGRASDGRRRRFFRDA